MTSFDRKAERQHGEELKQQLKEQFDLNKDGKLKGDERTAFKEALQARTAREAGVEHTHEKTKDGYQKSTYQRPDKDLTADEKNHGYAPSYSEKRFTGRDTGGLAPKAEADVKFRFNRSDLTPEAERAVADVAAEINRIQRENNGTIPAGTKITVHGHTDSIGDDSYNQTLSEQRAKAAKDAIVKATGIDPKSIEVVGHGEKKPVTGNNTREERAQNRRVEIDVKAPVKEKEAPEPAPAARADNTVDVKPAAPAPEKQNEEPNTEVPYYLRPPERDAKPSLLDLFKMPGQEPTPGGVPFYLRPPEQDAKPQDLSDYYNSPGQNKEKPQPAPAPEKQNEEPKTEVPYYLRPPERDAKPSLPDLFKMPGQEPTPGGVPFYLRPPEQDAKPRDLSDYYKPGQNEEKPQPAPAPEPKNEEPKPATAPIQTPSLIPLPDKATLAQTRVWSESNMRNYNGLDPAGKGAFEQQIQAQYKPWGDKDQRNPGAFFDQQVSDAAARELKEATRSRVEYYTPLTTSPVPAPIQSRVVTEKDPIKIHEILRSVSDLPGVMSDLKTNPDVAAVRNSLPQKQNWFSREDGVHQEAFDARLRGDTAKAEALFLRSLIENNDIRDLEKGTKAITGALGTNPDLKDGIKKSYQDSFGTDLMEDLRKANASIVEPE